MKIYLDMDGVLTDFNTRYIERFGAFPDCEDERRKHFWGNWKKFVDAREFETLDKHPFADKLLNAVESFRNKGVAVEILSSSGGGYSHDIVVEQKKMWLANHGITYKANIVPGGARKAEFADPWNILIDDTPKVVDNYLAHGGDAILHKDVDDTIQRLSELYTEYLSTSYRRYMVTAQNVQRLRNDTDAPMMECKKALIATDGDFEKAKEWIRSGHKFRTWV